MEEGVYIEANTKKVAGLTTGQWESALAICKEHIRLKIGQRMLSGVYSEANLGSDPYDHYLSLAYEKILTGKWEWKDDRSLSEQMIRIINSEFSKEVARKKAETSHLSRQVYPGDSLPEFYQDEEPEANSVEQTVNRVKLEAIEKACQNDEQLSFIVEALKEGKKRAEIAELLDITPKQFDKLREKLLRRVQSTQM